MCAGRNARADNHGQVLYSNFNVRQGLAARRASLAGAARPGSALTGRGARKGQAQRLEIQLDREARLAEPGADSGRLQLVSRGRRQRAGQGERGSLRKAAAPAGPDADDARRDRPELDQAPTALEKHPVVRVGQGLKWI
jgi:hypothetical protein